MSWNTNLGVSFIAQQQPTILFRQISKQKKQKNN